MTKVATVQKKSVYKSLNVVYSILLIIWSLLFSLFITLDLLFFLPLLGTSCFGLLITIFPLFLSPIIFICVSITLFLQLRKANRKTQIIIFILGLASILFYLNGNSFEQLLLSYVHVAKNCDLLG